MVPNGIRAPTSPSLEAQPLAATKAVSASTELGWVLTLAIVSVLSAAIGAVIMVTVMQCRSRMKNVGSRGLCSLCLRVPPDSTSTDMASREESKEPTAVFHSDSSPPVGGRVWTWLTARRTTAAPPQLTTSSVPAENHYTVDEAYTAVGEALYAELDRDSNHTPAYQNTAYTGSDIEPDAPVSSAPSSAYYSDLSSTTVPERTYEAIGMASLMEPSWDGSGEVTHRKHPMSRLAAITETITVPSDYV
uniref:Uncharacterized protein n=1 Tax=Timema poppense TaxID=170557 RepID=A0A7R9CG31_TIMPO|nr:unnamed protein product [Timema poppensis]